MRYYPSQGVEKIFQSQPEMRIRELHRETKILHLAVVSSWINDMGLFLNAKEIFIFYNFHFVANLVFFTPK